MPITKTIKLHDHRSLWEEHMPLKDVLTLKATTPDYVWQTTYQGRAIPLGGSVFLEEWWQRQNRYSELPSILASWISLDTASSEQEHAAYTAWTIGGLLPDYKLAILGMGRVRVELPDLLTLITDLANSQKSTLRGIIIEDKSSGISALQTLKKQPSWFQDKMIGFNPKVEKPIRWNSAAVWCKLGCVLLPQPGPTWLLDAEAELFAVPFAVSLDQADSFSQLIIFLEPMLSRGYSAREDKS